MQWVRWLLYIIFFLAVLVLSWHLFQNISDLRSLMGELGYYDTINGKLSVTAATLLEFLSAGWLGSDRVSLADVENLKSVAAGLEQSILQSSLVLGGVMLIFALLPALLQRGSRLVIQPLILISGVLLALGLWAPMLTLTIRVELPLLGWVVLDTTTRGLLESVWLFLTQTNWLLGVIILLFSVVVPILKLLLMQYELLRPTPSGRLAEWLASIGKFSMLDVLVVALTVSLFAYSSSANTDARAGIGLYYFAGYCLVSLLASVLMSWRHLDVKQG